MDAVRWRLPQPFDNALRDPGKVCFPRQVRYEATGKTRVGAAASMIGFIALAGIIARNSILPVDFIRRTRSPDKSLREPLLEAGMIRFKPIVLTAAAAMIGAAVILTDPVFRGWRSRCCSGLALR